MSGKINGMVVWYMLKGLSIICVAIGLLGFFGSLSLEVPREGYTYLTEPHPDRWFITFTCLTSCGMGFVVFQFLAHVLQSSFNREVLMQEMLKKIESLEKKSAR